VAIIAAIVLGIAAPQTAVKMKFLGSYFIEIIKLFIVPIIFFTIVLGIAGMGNLKKVGRIGLKAVIYFELVSTFSLFIGIAVGLIFKPGHVITSSLSIPIAKNPSSAENFSWLAFLQSNTTI
jgi:aerobic C4-dicarboxylate transport protein